MDRKVIEKELFEFAKRMRTQGLNPASAMALLVSQAAFSFGMTLKANEMGPEKG